MVKWHSGKRKWFLFAVALLVSVIALAIGISWYLESLYPQSDIYSDESNIIIRGTVVSITENYKAEGMNSYHIFRHYISVNISKVVWVSDDLARNMYDFLNESLSSGKTVGIGYDNLDNPQLSIGQAIECKGFYLPATDAPQSFKITIAPAISESYLKSQIS